VQQAYALMRTANFSREVLEPGAGSLTVLPVHGVLWADWGTPDRVVRTLRRIGRRPRWLAAWPGEPAALGPARGRETARGADAAAPAGEWERREPA
jgi:hypothetical protein